MKKQETKSEIDQDNDKKYCAMVKSEECLSIAALTQMKFAHHVYVFQSREVHECLT